MATLRDIKRRIQSVSNTQQITKAMKMIAAARLTRAQNAAKGAQPYALRLRELLHALGAHAETHPLFQTPEKGGLLILHFTSDRGLCGGFNTRLNQLVFQSLPQLRAALPQAEAPVDLVFAGKTGRNFFQARGHKAWQNLKDLEPAQRDASLREMVHTLTQGFGEGKWSRVILAYNHFHHALNQEPRLVTLLPVSREKATEDAAIDRAGTDRAGTDSTETGHRTGGHAAGESATANASVLFEPDFAGVLDTLLPQYLQNQLLTALLNTTAGEHAARMVAMEGATKNAGEMITRLTLQYNRLRQAAITKELIEIVNGSQSLEG